MIEFVASLNDKEEAHQDISAIIVNYKAGLQLLNVTAKYDSLYHGVIKDRVGNEIIAVDQLQEMFESVGAKLTDMSNRINSIIEAEKKQA